MDAPSLPMTLSASPPLHACGKKMIPCLFGYPDDDMMLLARKGEVKLMGCIIRGFNPPSHWCPYCRRYHHDQTQLRRL